MESEVRQMKAPFLADGSLLHYLSPYAEGDPYTTVKEAEPFRARLTITGLRRGRSAAYFMWQSETGATFPMFMKDMVDLVTHGTVVKGVADDEWTVQKRGTNYGIRRVKDQ
jgi:hypothetical protein